MNLLTRQVYWLAILLIQVLSVYKTYGEESESQGYLSWQPFQVFNDIESADAQDIHRYLDENQRLASDLINQNVYISMTTISSRLRGIIPTIQSLISGRLLPNHIYVVVSRDPWLIDSGVTHEQIFLELSEILVLKKVYPFISIVFTENIGPHRKLLPLLRWKWDEDCVIVTVDDHEIYKPTALAGLVQYYVASGRDAVVALRCRRMAVCKSSPLKLAPYTRYRRGLWPEANPGYREYLTLPTGSSGILYRPQFFNKTMIFDRNLVNLTVTGDDLMFRLVALAAGVPVVMGCTAETLHHEDIYCPPYPPANISKSKSASTLMANNTAELSRLLTDIVSIPSNQSSNYMYRLLRTKTIFRQFDPRKRNSLSSRYNIRGGNDVMWKNAAEYLKLVYNFDFNMLLNENFPIEREECNTTCTSCTSSWFQQQISDPLCGVVNC